MVGVHAGVDESNDDALALGDLLRLRDAQRGQPPLHLADGLGARDARPDESAEGCRQERQPAHRSRPPCPPHPQQQPSSPYDWAARESCQAGDAWQRRPAGYTGLPVMGTYNLYSHTYNR
jgi:hypothetical protein